VDEDILQRWGDFGASAADDPYPLYAELRRQGPVRRVTLGDGHSAWLVTRYEDAREALTNPAIIKSSERARVLLPAELGCG
jgi:cytochrome P450